MQGYYLRLSIKLKREQLVDALSIQHVDTPHTYVIFALLSPCINEVKEWYASWSTHNLTHQIQDGSRYQEHYVGQVDISRYVCA